MTNSVHYPTDLIKEEIVNYQHPFLFLKIWEIQSDRILSGFPEIWPWHYHKEVEFLIVTNGSIGIQTENDYHTLIEGDIMLLGTSQLHRTHKATTSPLSFIVF